MKPGTKVVLVGDVALLGTLVQPVLVGDERRWSIEWADGFIDHPRTTWPERDLYPLVPQ